MKKYGLNLAKGLIALVLLGAGGAKLAGIPELHQSFHLLGLPEWFGYFIGACEIAGAVGMFITPLSALAALGIAMIMGGAIYFHILHTPLTEGIPALIVLALCFYVFQKTKVMMLKFSKT
jgi:putative oxidoreductase